MAKRKKNKISNPKLKVVLIVIGVLLSILAAIWNPVVVYHYKVIPADFDITTYYKGYIKEFNQTTLELEKIPFDLKRHVKSLEATDKYLLASEKYVFTGSDGKLLPEKYQLSIVHGIDRRTGEYVWGYGDINRTSRWGFPPATQKKDYRLWDVEREDVYRAGYIDAFNATGIAHFISEDEREGVPVYYFEGTESHKYIGPGPPSTPNGTMMYYGGYARVWVEPVSGVCVDIERCSYRTVDITADIRRLPEDFDMTTNLSGRMRLFNDTTLEYETYNLSVQKHIWVDKIVSDEVYILNGNTTIINTENGEPLIQSIQPQYRFLIFPLINSTVDGIEPKTCLIVDGYGNANRSGRYTFPVGVDKVNYTMWNLEIQNTSVLHFLREEEHHGINTYVYETCVADFYIGSIPIPIEGIDGVITITYNGTVTYWVEPNTGFIVDTNMNSTRELSFPDMRYIPDNLNKTYNFNGTIRIMGGEPRNVTIEKSVKVANYTYIGDEKILLIYDNMTMTLTDSGDILLQEYDLCGVNAKTAEHVPGYGNVTRSGLLTFPIGVEKGEKYELWNTEIHNTSIASFIGEKNYCGVHHIYLYEVNEVNRLATISIYGINITGYYNCTITYWVEPNTGIIIQTLIDSEFRTLDNKPVYMLNIQTSNETLNAELTEAVVLSDKVKLSENTIVGVEIDIGYTDEQVIKSVNDALLMSKMVSLGDKPFVGFVIYYKMTNESVIIAVKEALKYKNMIIFAEFYVPLILIASAVIMILIGTYTMMRKKMHRWAGSKSK